MTPARKEALLWLNEHGEVEKDFNDVNMPTTAMLNRMANEGEVDIRKAHGKTSYRLSKSGKAKVWEFQK